MRDTTYWASKPTAEAAKEWFVRIDGWYQWLRVTGTYDTWLRTLREFYAGFQSGADLGTAGDQDEFITSKENHFHNIGQNIITMITGPRPYFEPKAANTDHASASQTIIAKGLLDMALKEKELESVGVNVVTDAGALFGEGFSTCVWDPGLGREYAANPDTGRNERTGDIKLRAHLPIDVARDCTKADADAHEWYAIRRWVNRYNLMAERPEMADKILGLPARWDEGNKRQTFSKDWRGALQMDSDDCAVWECYHEKTPALPDGRLIMMCADDCILFDGPLPYDNLAMVVQRCSAEEMRGTSLGYTVSYDLMPAQHEINAADSSITTAIGNVGTGIIWRQPGGNISIQDLVGGPKVISCTTKPEPLTLLDVTSLKAMDDYKRGKIQAMEAISGVNSARRGTLVNDKAMSGAALAILDAKTIEHSKGLERSYVAWLEKVATSIVKLYHRFAKVPMVAMIAGKANRSYMRQFTGDDLDRIERVQVDLGNPLARTTSGRLQIADTLLERNMIKTPEQYIQVLQTGRLEPVIEATTAELMRIRAENERLSDGKPVQALATDNHPLDLKEHAVVLASPESREDPEIVQNVLAHMQEHITLWQTTDPALLAALGVPPPPMPAMPAMPPGAPGAEPMPGGEPPPNGPQAPEMSGPETAGNMPSMPTDPTTGEQAQFPQ